MNPVYSALPSLQRDVALGLEQLNVRGLVVISGASGVGKTHLAKWFHSQSRYSGGEWVVQSAASLVESRFESELFGHTKGAFTGAVQSFPGLLGMAAGGVLLIESLEDLPMEGQGRWLRLLESKSYRPVGGTQELTFSGGVIFTCKTPIQTLLDRGVLREDFFFRLLGTEVSMPPLAYRSADFDKVCAEIAAEVLQDLGSESFRFRPEELEACRSRAFPGGWHQLRNLLVRAAILQVPPDAIDLEGAQNAEFHLPSTGSLKTDLAELEKMLLERALAGQPESRQALAEQLGISLRALQYKLQRYDLNDST